MARQGITYDQVRNAADAIRARGMEPTIAMVRAEMGSGSFSTISQHLSRWKSDLIASGAAMKEAAQMPEELEAKLLEMGAMFYAEVSRQSEQAIRAAKQEAADRIKEAQGEAAAFREEAEELAKQLEKAKAELDRAKTEITNNGRRIAALESENKTRIEMMKELTASLKPQDGKTKEVPPKKSAESGSKPA